MAPRALELSRLREVSLGHRSLLIIVTVGVVAFFFISRLSPLPASSAPLTAHIIYLPLLARGSSGATLGGCQMFPANNIWNTRIDALPLDPHSADYIDFTGRATSLHPDFGANWNGGPFGIPFDLISGTQPMAPISFDYSDESDPGPYPVPANPSIEKGSDAHMLLLDTGHCVLYETWNTRYDGGWQAGSGAKFDLNSNALRPATWTSAGAAGLPILPGLVRYEEVMAGEINHAIRFTVKGTNNTYIWPARHRTYYNYRVDAPPMGQRFRLKGSFDMSTFSPPVQVILTAFKRYGIIVADNGSNWFISGAPDARWDDDMLVGEFRRVHGSDFEAVDESGLMTNPDSGEAR